MNIGSLMLPTAMLSSQGSTQPATADRDFLSQVLQGQDNANQHAVGDNVAAELVSQPTSDSDSLSAVEQVASAASRMEAHASTLLVEANIQLGSAMMSELYPQQWLATGHLSYKAGSLNSSHYSAVTGSAGSATIVQSASSTDRSAEKANAHNGNTAETHSGLFAAHQDSLRKSERDNRNSDTWRRHVTQAIADTLQPWLKRRISVQIGSDVTNILIRDYSASDAENNQTLQSLMEQLDRHKQTSMRITINGHEHVRLSSMQTSVKENANAR